MRKCTQCAETRTNVRVQYVVTRTIDTGTGELLNTSNGIATGYELECLGCHHRWVPRNAQKVSDVCSKKAIEPWLMRLSEHGDGVALIPARIETQWFHRTVWPHASGVFVFKGRLTYLHREATSERAKFGANAMFPSVLISYGGKCREWLRNVRLNGVFLDVSKAEIRTKGDRQLTL